jgi:predicted alpha/beta-fold hydrolase
VKDHFILKNEKVLREFDDAAVDAALNADTLQDFLDASAPFAGYPNASEYYKGENPVNDLQYITTPTFVLNSLDDPCCNVDNLYETSPNPNHGGRSYAQIVRDSKRGLIAVTKTGSHCPFLDGRWVPFIRDPLDGGWMLKSWADEVGVEFYVAALQVYDERRFM